MTRARPELAHLDLAGTSGPWVDLGFSVEHDVLRVGSIDLRFVDGDRGLVGWGLRNVELHGHDDLDGVPSTLVVDAPPAEAVTHPNGANVIDHVVLRTPDIDRTLAVLAEAGLELRRLREVPDSTYHQAFYRLGETILEVVGEPGRHDDAPSALWGLVCTVADADAASSHAADRLGAWKDAVQPGRRIATVRRSAGLTTAVALMTA
ncbi:MAG: VOC family protein [Actinomycetota bacterium]